MAFGEVVQVIFVSVQAVHRDPDEDACNEGDNSEDTVVPYKKRVGSEGYCCWGSNGVSVHMSNSKKKTRGLRTDKGLAKRGSEGRHE